MKRLLIIAAIVALAASCQKTTINDGVQNAIGFSSEVGKQIKALASGTTYSPDQPFGVYSYGYKVDNKGKRETAIGAGSSPMRNVEVIYNNDEWKSNPTHGTYYWPNDPSTRLDFYAYTPYIKSTDVNKPIPPTKANVPHMVMVVENLNHTEAAGLTFDNYTHTNMYVDFMEATKVEGATFGDQDGKLNEDEAAEKVPVSFNHKMTQIRFKVTTASAFPGVNFEIRKISLKGIKNVGAYSSMAKDPWTESGSNTYVIFPADTDNGAVSENTKDANDATLEAPKTIGNQNAQTAPEEYKYLLTTGVTMIPQGILAETQAFEIVYHVSGTGVATEEVTKLVYFEEKNAATPSVDWIPNKCITYVVKINLNEIIFDTPTVKDWDPTNGEEHEITQ